MKLQLVAPSVAWCAAQRTSVAGACDPLLAAGAYRAIELIRRIPYYSEKLLAKPRAAATKPK